MLEQKKEEATRERLVARRHGMKVRLQRRRNELARKHHLDIMGVEGKKGGWGEGTEHDSSGSGSSSSSGYEHDLQGVDAYVATTAPSGARLAPKNPHKAYPMASTMSKRQHDDHLRRIKRAARLASLDCQNFVYYKSNPCDGCHRWVTPQNSPY